LDNPALDKSSSKKGSFAFRQKETLHQLNTQRWSTCSKRHQSACTSTVVISPDASCPITSNTSAVKTPETLKGTPSYPEQAQEGDMQM